MGNSIFQRAKEAVSHLVGKQETEQQEHQMAQPKHEEQNNVPNHENAGGDQAIAENLISSAMADSSDAERQQLAELQKELDQSETT